MATVLTDDKFESIVASTELTNLERAVLWDTFCVTDAVLFAKCLHRAAKIPDLVKGQILALKISHDQNAQESRVVNQAIEAAISRFQQRQTSAE